MNSSVIAYHNKEAKKNPLTKEETHNLIRIAQSGSDYARNLIIEHNMGMVTYLLFRFYGYVPQDQQDDYFQEGIIGLMKAIEGFKSDLGFEFSTYAFWWIRQAMQRYRANHHMIRMPIYAQEIQHLHRKHMEEDPHQDEDELIERIAKEKGATVKNVRDIIGYDLSTSSLDVPSEDGSFMDLPSELHSFSELDRCDLDELICNLIFREFRLMSMRLQGFNNVEISEIEGISRERVRQILDKATINLKKISAKGSAQ